MNALLFPRIDAVYLPVRDLDQAIDWYAAHLGWELCWRTEGAATLQAGPTPLTLVRFRYPGVREQPAGFTFQPLAEVGFSVFTPDIARAHATLERLGVPVSPLSEHGLQREFEFRDPDGNRVAVCWWPE